MKTNDNEQRDMNSRYKCLSPKTNYAFSSKGKNTEESENIENKRDNKLNDSRTSKKSSVSMYLERRHRESQEKLNKLRAEINYYQENDMTFKPKISDNSQKIVERLVEDRFESNKAGRRAFNAAIKENTKSWQVIKRYNLRKWGYERLGITKWRFFENTRDKTDDAVKKRWSKAVAKPLLSEI